MNVLAVVHGASVPPGTFGEEVARRGHELDEWSFASATPLPRTVDEYGAVMIFGGSMHADEDDDHPWLRDENLFIQRVLGLRIPLLGVCLGAQLIAKAANANVTAMPEPEIGWFEVARTTDAAGDPIMSLLPERFEAFQWHFYEFDTPSAATELARSGACSQAFRLGDLAWGVEFHPEITRPILDSWLAEAPEEVPVDATAFLAAFDERIEEWTALGRALCGGFMSAAERRAGSALER